MKDQEKTKHEEIAGDFSFPAEWTVFAPLAAGDPLLSAADLKSIPEEIEAGGKKIAARQVAPTRNQYDFQPFFGPPPYDGPHVAWVFLALASAAEQEATFGLGADYYLQAWLDGVPVLDTTEDGNGASPPSINDHRVTVRLRAGRNILAVRFINGKASALLALGGPRELRGGDFTSILPPPPRADAAFLAARYPPDPNAPLRWVAPAGFDPLAPDLSLPPLAAAEHVEIYHALRCGAALEDGGDGVYESLRHGTWNHNIHAAFVFRDHLVVSWDNHARDENGPGGRVLARVGRILNPAGEVAWDGPNSLVEIAPAPVPVRRRLIQSDRDAVRGAQARGSFCLVAGRLFFCGSLEALHGYVTDPACRARAGGRGQLVPAEHFYFGPGPETTRGNFARWDLGFRFYQEWDVRDGRLQPVSPLYKENDLLARLSLTPGLSLPLEPLVAPYRDAPLLADAPPGFREPVLCGERKNFGRALRYRPGTAHLAHDGLNGLVHAAEFRRPDGAWVAVRENQYPSIQPFYYAAEKPDAESYYPPARRTNLYGAVNPAAGELPGGRVFIVGNSPDRRTMFITVSADGRLFDRTWFLLHRQLSDYTPGAMKREGGPGSGPQYFVPALAGESLWLVYSLSKEHIGATRMPLDVLCA